MSKERNVRLLKIAVFALMAVPVLREVGEATKRHAEAEVAQTQERSRTTWAEEDATGATAAARAALRGKR